MDRVANLNHWERWASEYGAELRATTKCVSIKRLEIEALLRRIAPLAGERPLVLEVGCGNGTNGFALAARHSQLEYLGLDFSAKMIEHAVDVVGRADAGLAARVAFG